MTHVDVLVVGAGPAGATAALNLAPTRSVLMVDCRDFRSASSGVGESLVPAARRLLRDMGLFDSFVAQGHAPWYGNRFVWGGESAAESDLIRDMDGHGWHLDRARFDLWLRTMAAERGAGLIAPARVVSLEADSSGGWFVTLAGNAGPSLPMHASVLIDASGKFATLARRLGARRQSTEQRMICAWLPGVARRETPATAGFTLLEAVEDGWWYTAPLPDGRRLLAFHTDPDLPAARFARSRESLLRHSAGAPLLASTLEKCGFSSNGSQVAVTLACGGALCPAAGPRWFAAGDAAIHFDPLASQGLFNALFTGLASAEATDRMLAGEDPGCVAESYQRLIGGVKKEYLAHREWHYRQERRWPGTPFWERRHAEQ
jgi:flavin-dependent dehydrogenase